MFQHFVGAVIGWLKGPADRFMTNEDMCSIFQHVVVASVCINAGAGWGGFDGLHSSLQIIADRVEWVVCCLGCEEGTY